MLGARSALLDVPDLLLRRQRGKQAMDGPSPSTEVFGEFARCIERGIERADACLLDSHCFWRSEPHSYSANLGRGTANVLDRCHSAPRQPLVPRAPGREPGAPKRRPLPRRGQVLQRAPSPLAGRPVMSVAAPVRLPFVLLHGDGGPHDPLPAPLHAHDVRRMSEFSSGRPSCSSPRSP